MKLYFENSYNERKFLAECSTREEIFDAIKKFLDEHHYKSYYYRFISHDNEIHIDVGSWSEFFVVTDAEKQFY